MVKEVENDGEGGRERRRRLEKEKDKWGSVFMGCCLIGLPKYCYSFLGPHFSISALYFLLFFYIFEAF